MRVSAVWFAVTVAFAKVLVRALREFISTSVVYTEIQRLQIVQAKVTILSIFLYTHKALKVDTDRSHGWLRHIIHEVVICDLFR